MTTDYKERRAQCYIYSYNSVGLGQSRNIRKVPAFRSHKYISSIFRPRNITSSRLSDSPSPPVENSVLPGDFPGPGLGFFAPLDLFDRAADVVWDEVIGVPILHTNGPRLFVFEGGGVNCGSTVRDSSAGFNKASPKSIASRPPCRIATMTARSRTSNASRRLTSPILLINEGLKSSCSSLLHKKRPFNTDLPLESTIVVLWPPRDEKNKAGGP